MPVLLTDDDLRPLFLEEPLGLVDAAEAAFRENVKPRREDRFTGLAPALVYPAGFDPLCDEGEAYAQSLEAAGVPVRYRCLESLCHSFTNFGAIPAAAAAQAEIARDVERILTGGDP